MLEDQFWRKKSLSQMNREEWEAVCDGCALCCLQKLEDEDSGEVFYTDVVCRYLHEETCVCSDYKNRTVLVPGCLTLTKENVHSISWLPRTCAYRLLSEGKPLYDWHPLISGEKDSVHDASMSVRYKTISEDSVSEESLEDHIIHWVN